LEEPKVRDDEISRSFIRRPELLFFRPKQRRWVNELQPQPFAFDLASTSSNPEAPTRKNEWSSKSPKYIPAARLEFCPIQS
jgi:hypothetical protein